MGSTVLAALPSNIGLGLKWLTATNTLAYYKSELFVAVKSFVRQVPRVRMTLKRNTLRRN